MSLFSMSFLCHDSQLVETSGCAVVGERRTEIIISGVFFFIASACLSALICFGSYQTVISFAVKTYCVLFSLVNGGKSGWCIVPAPKTSREVT